jgi:hypothetical protein
MISLPIELYRPIVENSARKDIFSLVRSSSLLGGIGEMSSPHHRLGTAYCDSARLQASSEDTAILAFDPSSCSQRLCSELSR